MAYIAAAMLKSAVHAHFGTLAKIAAVVGISKQGVWMWPKVVPQGHAYKLQVMTGGILKVDPTLYHPITRSGAAKRKAVNGKSQRPKSVARRAAK